MELKLAHKTVDACICRAPSVMFVSAISKLSVALITKGMGKAQKRLCFAATTSCGKGDSWGTRALCIDAPICMSLLMITLHPTPYVVLYGTG